MKFRYLIFSLFCCLFVFNVSAKSLPMKKCLNNDCNDAHYFEGGRNLTLDLSLPQLQYLPDFADTPSYGYLKVCTDANITSYYSNTPDYLKNLQIIDTKVHCNFTATSTIQYITFDTVFACGTGGISCFYGGSLTFYQQATSNYKFLNYGYTDNPIEIDLTSGTIINQNDTIINNQNQTNSKLDDIINSDLNDKDKELPDDKNYQDYQDTEKDLLDKANQADLGVLDIPIDVNSSNFVWDTMGKILNSHPLLFSTLLAILSIGVIKLALGR